MAVRSRGPARRLDEPVQVAAGRRTGLVGVVGGGEAHREEGGRHHAEAGAMRGPLDDLALVLAGVDGGAGDHGVVAGRREERSSPGRA